MFTMPQTTGIPYAPYTVTVSLKRVQFSETYVPIPSTAHSPDEVEYVYSPCRRLLVIMVRRTKAEAAATREALLDAAEEVFLERGVANASLDLISRRAGVTRGALYWHFRNKGDLFRAMLDRVRMPFEDLITALDDPTLADRPLEALRLGCHAGVKHLDTPHHRRVHSILLHHCERSTDFDPLEVKDEIADECREVFLRHFRQAQINQQLREGLTPEQATRLFHYALSGQFWEWLRAPDAYSLREHGPELVDTLIGLIRRDPD